MTALPTTQATATVPTSASTTRRWRAGVVAAATAGALVTWLMATMADTSAVHVRMQGTTSAVGTVQVIFTAALVSLAGWGLFALLEHFTAAGRRIWTIIASVVLVLSFIAPASYGVGAASKASLIALHVVTGLILLAGLRRSPARS
jgi:hypothetical protein